MKKDLFYISALLAFSVAGIAQRTAEQVTQYTPQQGFVAHEWGTFTTLQTGNGRQLNGLHLEEEALPRFVANMCYCYTQLEPFGEVTNKGYTAQSEIRNVNVKMETPVIYFYTPEAKEKAVSVDIKFKNGSISQWYPQGAGESTYGAGRYQPSIKMGGTRPVFDFSQPRTGFIRWKAVILPKGDTSAFMGTSASTPQWEAQRATESNKVKIKGTGYEVYDPVKKQTYHTNQVEKFLFYRGLANFEPQLRVEFNTQDNLVITNNGNDKLSYVMVYEKKKDGATSVWWSGRIAGQQKKVVVPPAGKETKEVAGEMENFVQHLVEAGLYKDEALSMLATWKKSYFEHEGLKVFWIVPPAFTDEVLPLQIDPQPVSVKRVLVGRSEVLTPAFERELAELSESEFEKKYYTTLPYFMPTDRFTLAYKEARTTTPDQRTDYNVITEDEPETKETGVSESTARNIDQGLELFPNPVTGNLTFKVPEDQNGLTVKIFSEDGQLMKTFDNVQKGENTISMEELPAGVYLFRLYLADGNVITKKIVKASRP